MPPSCHNAAMSQREKAIYRILTEDVPGYRDTVIEVLDRHGFPYSTTMPCVGYGPDQGGKPENSVAIDAVLDYDPETDRRMVDAVMEIREKNGPNGQGCVLLLCVPAAAELVDGNGAPQGGRVLAAYGDWERLLERLRYDAVWTLFAEQIMRQREFDKSSEGERLRQYFREHPPKKEKSVSRCNNCGYVTREYEDLPDSLKEFMAHKCKGEYGYGGQEEAP